MSTEEIAANEQAADLARFAIEEYARLAAPGYLRELADPDVFEWLARDLITDLCHLADTIAVPGDRETWTLRAYRRYREEADRENHDQADAPAARRTPREAALRAAPVPLVAASFRGRPGASRALPDGRVTA